MKFILTISIFAGFISCSDLSKSDRLATLDELSGSLDSLAIALNEVDDSRLQEMMLSSDEVSERIDLLSFDTISYDLAVKLDRYREMGEQCRLIQKSFKDYNRTINEQQEALDKLSRDIEAGSGKREKYDEYIDFEQEKVSTLRSALSEYFEKLGEATDTFDELNVILNSELHELIDQSEVQ